MAHTCLWRAWAARIDLDANATVSQNVRTRVVALLAPAFAAITDWLRRSPLPPLTT